MTNRPARCRARSKRRRPAWLGLSLLALVGCACAQVADRDGAAEGRLAGGPLLRGEFENRLLLTGELEAVKSISIKSPQTSQFQMRIQFMAEEGAFLRRGEPLLDFDNSSFADQVRDLETQILDAETQIVSKRNELASALKDLEIEVAEREYEFERARLDASIDPTVVSRKEFGERELAVSKATRELEETQERIKLTRERGQTELDVLLINRDKLKKDLLSAQESLHLLSIKAPADGLVIYERRQGTTLRYQEGDSCWPGQSIMRLPDLSEMQVVFSVNEVDAPLLEQDMSMRITLDAFPGRELQGRIIHIPSMAVKRDERSKVAVFKVVARLSETWVGEMKPGMSALGRIVLSKLANVPLVARNAVRFDGEAYRLTDGHDLAGETIRPLARNDRFYLISDEEYARLAGNEAGGDTRRAAVGGST